MDYLQYCKLSKKYKFNLNKYVLNLVINGLPSIRQNQKLIILVIGTGSFKPCYKWITFNTDCGADTRPSI